MYIKPVHACAWQALKKSLPCWQELKETVHMGKNRGLLRLSHMNTRNPKHHTDNKGANYVNSGDVINWIQIEVLSFIAKMLSV